MQGGGYLPFSQFNGHPDPPSIFIFGKELKGMEDLARHFIKTSMSMGVEAGTMGRRGNIQDT